MTKFKCENTESFEQFAIFAKACSTIIIIKHGYLRHTSNKWIGNIVVLAPICVSVSCNMLNANSIYDIYYILYILYIIGTSLWTSEVIVWTIGPRIIQTLNFKLTIKSITSMLVTDVGDQMCWWQDLDAGERC